MVPFTYALLRLESINWTYDPENADFLMIENNDQIYNQERNTINCFPSRTWMEKTEVHFIVLRE
jgi:hypothetical protein